MGTAAYLIISHFVEGPVRPRDTFATRDLC